MPLRKHKPLQHSLHAMCCYHPLSTQKVALLAIEKTQGAHSILSAHYAEIIRSRLKSRPCLPLRDNGKKVNASTIDLLVLHGMDTETALPAIERAQTFRENLNGHCANIIYCGHKETPAGLGDTTVSSHRFGSHDTLHTTVHK